LKKKQKRAMMAQLFLEKKQKRDNMAQLFLKKKQKRQLQLTEDCPSANRVQEVLQPINKSKR
jgi:uncharacterized membrane protein YheB (UPF0754 family)